MGEQESLLRMIVDGLLQTGMDEQEAAGVAPLIYQRVEPILKERQERYHQLRSVVEQLLVAWPASRPNAELDEARRYLRQHCLRCGRAVNLSVPRADALCEECAQACV